MILKTIMEVEEKIKEKYPQISILLETQNKKQRYQIGR